MSRLIKLNLKYHGPHRSLASKNRLLEVCAVTLSAPPARVHAASSGWVAEVDPNQLDLLSSAKAKKEFEAIGLQLVEAPKQMARKCVIARGLDPDVGGLSSNEILQDLISRNPKLGIWAVEKIGSHTHLIKIKFQEVKKADQCLKLVCFSKTTRFRRVR